MQSLEVVTIQLLRKGLKGYRKANHKRVGNISRKLPKNKHLNPIHKMGASLNTNDGYVTYYGHTQNNNRRTSTRVVLLNPSRITQILTISIGSTYNSNIIHFY
ncbi:hypothetical protein EGR_04824 [Echinococcus granulosus]|uniref:Uncharacterized protein n=1 Tax=Echinococcus granulosus TaxID=6210 RepID=W6UGY1_ECHGR|nr:hypothetical protein EGR_04824 [Echinococcus granulosus]EUB60266.1 hypothetical protein EGR_04824 [Echinococcus granulosus]